MTAHAGDALSHVYFSRPSRRFFRAIFEAIFKTISSTNPQHIGVTILAPAGRAEGRVSSNLSGSARICMGAMSLRHGPNPVPRRLLCCNFANANEHFILQ